MIGELRAKLAQSCLDALEPDLVLLDEFQRFKHLLDPEQQSGALAGEFFNYSDDTADARVVLLSATPYKMFTTSDDDEDHYVNFLETYRFLRDDVSRAEHLSLLLADYRREILRVGSGDLETLRQLRTEIESELRGVACRTERLGVGGDHTGMLVQVTAGGAQLRPGDLLAYSALQRVSAETDSPDPLEYWKSAPYLLNFMTDYELKKAFSAALELDQKHEALAQILGSTRGLLLSWQDIEGYSHIDPGNARLRWLLDDILRNQLWKLLWIPPSMPYYQGGPPYDTAQDRNITKRLIFSAWRVVPQTIACLASYEIERRMMRAYDSSPSRTPEARRRVRPLRFSVQRRQADGNERPRNPVSVSHAGPGTGSHAPRRTENIARTRPHPGQGPMSPTHFAIGCQGAE